MVQTITPQNLILGPAKVYYRASGVQTPWTDLGPTLDDAVAHIVTTRFTPDNIAGVMGPVVGLDYLRKVECNVEFTMADMTGANLGLAIPGARTTAEVHADAGTTPFTSTLSAASAIGDTSISVVAATNATVGDFIRIEAAAAATVEYRQITAIAALVLSFRDPLIFAHASGVAAVETTGDKRTLMQSSITRRMPSSEYREWALVASNGAGYQELRIPYGISRTDSMDITFGETTLAGLRVTIGASYTGTDLSRSPFDLWSTN